MSHIQNPGTIRDQEERERLARITRDAEGKIVFPSDAPTFPVFEPQKVPVFAEVPVQHTPREQLLREAIQITTSDRNKHYGNPEDNFNNIANFWNLYLGNAGKLREDSMLCGIDVAHMMVLMKMARLSTNPLHRDSILDVAGYAACAADFVK